MKKSLLTISFLLFTAGWLFAQDPVIYMGFDNGLAAGGTTSVTVTASGENVFTEAGYDGMGYIGTFGGSTWVLLDAGETILNPNKSFSFGFWLKLDPWETGFRVLWASDSADARRPHDVSCLGPVWVMQVIRPDHSSVPGVGALNATVADGTDAEVFYEDAWALKPYFDQWVHVAMTSDFEFGDGVAYINGVATGIGEASFASNTPSQIPYMSKITLGNTFKGLVNKGLAVVEDLTMGGMIDEFYLFDKFLTAEEVLKMMSGELKPAASSVVKIDRNSFGIYPNPASDYIMIRTSDVMDITVSNMVGQEVFRQKNVAGGHKIDISTLKNGLYLISATSGSEKFVQKLVKR